MIKILFSDFDGTMYLHDENGDYMPEENLKALGEAGLDELRFNLGASHCSDRVIANIALAKKYKQSLRIVTVEGELINPGGAMTGGAFKNSSNLLSRRREIEEIENKVALLKKEMQEMERILTK